MNSKRLEDCYTYARARWNRLRHPKVGIPAYYFQHQAITIGQYKMMIAGFIAKDLRGNPVIVAERMRVRVRVNVPSKDNK